MTGVVDGPLAGPTTASGASLRELVAYSPLITRPSLRWPGGRPLAVWVVVNVEHYEYLPPPAVGRVTWDRVPHEPDVREYSFRDYGNRVGIWRILDRLSAADVATTLSLNLAVLDLFPRIRDVVIEPDLCVMSHGIFNTRFLYGMDEDAERAFYRDNLESLRRHTGRQLQGMLTPAVTNTPNTPRLMAEAGLTYHADWVHDDQPVPLRVGGHRMVSMPYSYDLNDAPLWDGRPYSGDYLVDATFAQLDRLLADAERYGTGFVACLALHPYQIGQPQHIGRLERILDRLANDERLWLATGDKIAAHYITHYYDEQLAHAEALEQEVGRAR